MIPRIGCLLAIETLTRLTTSNSSCFLLKAGPEISEAVRGEGFSARKWMNDLMEFIDGRPNHHADGGPLEMVIVEKAAQQMLDCIQNSLDESAASPTGKDAFRVALRQDGFVLGYVAPLPTLPADIGIPSIKSELKRLF